MNTEKKSLPNKLNKNSSVDRILILTGGSVDMDWAKKWLVNKEFDFVIAADKGLEYADALNLEIGYILGDYDSVESSLIDHYRKSNTEVKTYPCEKDYTDTNLAVLRAIAMNPQEIVILGGSGTRLDHTMANIFNLKLAMEKGIRCYLINERNRIQLIDHEFTISKKQQYGKYVSLLPMTTQVTGITLTGFYYPLHNYTMEQGVSVGISNEIENEDATITVKNGILIVFESKD